jgi:iron complex outermembrane receptor protein
MRVTAVAVALCLSVVGLAASPTVDASIRKPTNIPAQELETALRALEKDRNLQVIFVSEDVRDVRTQGAVGELTSDEALKKLLTGTGLTFRYLDEKTVTIVPVSSSLSSDTSGTSPSAPNTQPPPVTEEPKVPSDRFRMAQVDQGTSSASSSVKKKSDQEAKKKGDELQEVVVTGSRIPTVAGNEVQPVRSYTREDIENSGQTTMGEFLNTLPDVSIFTNSSAIAGKQTVQLHGLPVGTTLTLLDGRRLETDFYGSFNLSNIPLAAVERIEILPVGASAVYGADALAGAVNTILRKDFNGFEANATWEHASGVNDPSASLAWGKSWERGSISLIGSYQERGELLGTQREPTSLTSLPANLPAPVVSAIADYNCAPGNVYSVDGSNLPGLSSPYAAIPAGITGTPTIGQFATTAGKQNLCNANRYLDITPQSQREGALLSAHYLLAESVDLFTEVLFSHQHLQNQTGPQIVVSQSSGGTVAANNPYNPFGQEVNVSFAYPGPGTVEDESTSLIQPLIGVRGSFLSNWHYEVTAYLSRDQLYDVGASPDTQLISNALSSSNPATALNPFASGAPGTPQLLSSLTNPAVDISSRTFNDRIVSGQGILRGPVLQLPAGALKAVIGGEYSQAKQDTTYGGSSASAAPYLLQRNTYAVFSEARIPLLAGGAPAQGDERLALTLAGRYDHSNDYGGKGTWQSGLLWHASETLSFRGGYGLSYQAPQLNQISGPTSVFPLSLGVPDPFRGNQLISYPVTFVFGPNRNLKPETGDSLTLGLQYSSQALPGLHTSLTWYDLRISNYIGPENLEPLVANPNLFPGAVVRAPATPQDQQQGFLGVITQLNYGDYNFGDLRVAGFDADVSYAIETRAGQFTPSVAIANVYRWQSAILPGTPAIDAVSQATLFGVGWSPRWKGTAALAWKKGPLSMNLAGRYIGRYLDYQDFVPNTNEIGNTWIFDFNARYEVGQALASTNPWLARSYVAIGAVNLLNKTPPFSYSPSWYDFQEYDLRGRYLHLNVGVRF